MDKPTQDIYEKPFWEWLAAEVLVSIAFILIFELICDIIGWHVSGTSGIITFAAMIAFSLYSRYAYLRGKDSDHVDPKE